MDSLSFSKTLERFLRSFGDEAQAGDWLATLCVFGELSPRAWAEIESFLDGVASYSTEPTEIHPWNRHPEIVVAMPTAHACALALVQAIWATTDKPALPPNATDAQVREYLADNRDVLVKAFTRLGDAADYGAWLRLSAQVGIERARVGVPSDEVPPAFIPNDLQTAVLKALKGRALKLEPLAVLVSNGDTSRLYRAGGFRELRAAGLVLHKRGVGFYLPDFSPR